MTGFGVYPLRHGPALHDDGTVTFRVWAPRASTVAVELTDGRRDMEAVGRGWFAAADVPAPDDGRYAFRLDDGPARPDPASLRQPDGVHAASALVDRAGFAWSPEEATWRPPRLASGAVYELHVGTFTSAGTFGAAIGHLAELRDLGVTHVEVMPVNAYNGPRGWGYDGVGWYAVHEPYGGPGAFAAFVDACHRHGIAVILDVVYNHFGPSGSYHHEFGPYVTDMHRTPWGPAINLDQPGADAVRAFIVDNALMWLADFHVDGLRLDAVHALHDGSADPILAELSAAVDHLSEQLGRRLVLIAESDRQDPMTVLPRAAGGLGMSAQWLDDLHHALHVTVTGEDDGYYADYDGLVDVAAAYERGFVYDGRWSDHRGRTVGAPLPTTVSGRRFVGCIQNHDQVGNRALGQRLATLVDDGRLRLAVSLLALSPMVPMLFMGDEYGATTPFLFFSSHPEDDLAEAVRTGRREEFAAFAAFADAQVPDPQAERTFTDSRLDRAEADAERGRAMRRLWTDLLRLRRVEPALATGDRRLIRTLSADPAVMAVLRDDPVGFPPLAVVANASATSVSRTLPLAGAWTTRWSSTAAEYGGDGADVALDGSDGGLRCGLPPWSVAVLTPRSVPHDAPYGLDR